MPRGTGELQILARELGADERSLRRAVEVGALRCRRPSARRLKIDAAEKDYLRGHWPILSALRAALRTEPNVRTAVLFGSVARGTEGERSDLDLLIKVDKDSMENLALLEARLEERLGWEIQAVRLIDAEASPPFLYTIVQEGRPLVDRDGTWRHILQRSQRLKQRAAAVGVEQSTAAHAALDSLIATAR